MAGEKADGSPEAPAADVRERGSKTPDDSRTEVTRTVVFADINGENRLFGGRLMEWIDDAAGIAARRHCGGSITTACVDQLQFRHAAYLNDIVVIDAQVTYVGRTSLEVRVDSYVENVRTGERVKINKAYLTEVHVDAAGNPVTIPYGLELTSDPERAEYAAAEKRKELRKQRKVEHF